MAFDVAKRAEFHRKARFQDAIEYRLLFAVCFAVMLPAALVMRVLPGRRNLLTGQAGGVSPLAEARSAAHATAGYAFMR